VEVAMTRGVPAYLLESFRELRPEWLEGRSCVGVTAGASAPEDIVQALVAHLARTYGARIEERDVIPENVSFPLPSALSR
jgi:4-hydroxy-3-methylbut-2-enyl diphosphate reductase